MSASISVTESLHINRPPDLVWNFTQDYARRHEWDASILEAEVISPAPDLQVRIRARGALSCVFQYKLFDRPRRTSLAMTQVQSAIITGGGGSWQYEPLDDGCLWTQVNSVILKDAWWAALLRPAVAWTLRRQTRAAMKKAKKLIEQSS